MLNSVGTISYFFPTLMTSLGYTGQKSQCEYREATRRVKPRPLLTPQS